MKVSVIDGSSPFASAYDLENIIGSYRERNRKLTKTRLVNTNLMNKENLTYLKSRWMYFRSQSTVYVYIFFLFLCGCGYAQCQCHVNTCLVSAVTTVLSCPEPVWTIGRAAASPFELNVRIRYPIELIRYPLSHREWEIQVIFRKPSWENECSGVCYWFFKA